jgi:hypothetical protein
VVSIPEFGFKRFHRNPGSVKISLRCFADIVAIL